MNKDVWNSMPPDIQKIIDEASEKYNSLWIKKMEETEDQAIKTWRAKGHQYIQLSKAEHDRWSQAIAPVFDTYIKEKTARGLPAADAIAFCKDWAKKNAK